MLDLLHHLLPTFSFDVLTSGSTAGLSTIFWLFMAVIFIVAAGLVCRHLKHFSSRLNMLERLIQGQTLETLAESRRELKERAGQLTSKELGTLWIEFDESLVISTDHSRLFNTLDAEHFFNAKTLAPGLTGSRLLAATPSFLVAIGVLGTFIGLTVGLEGLTVQSSDVEMLKSGIDQLISGAAVAFMTSVWGVAFSLLLNVIEKAVEHSVLKRISKLQHQIDALYPRLTAEHSLVQIAEDGKESRQALQELHERIGDRLQESINGMTEGFQSAIVEALASIMGPTMEKLVDITSQHSTDVLGKLMANFMDGMSSAGREQSQNMQSAAASVNAAVGEMGGQIHMLTQSMLEQQQRQQQDLDERHQAFTSNLNRQNEASDQRIAQLEQRFQALMGGLTEQLERQLAVAQARDEARQADFERKSQESSAHMNALLEQFARTSQARMDEQASSDQARRLELEQSIKGVMGQLSQQLSDQFSANDQREQARLERDTLAREESSRTFETFKQVSHEQLSAITEANARQQRELTETVGQLLNKLNDQMSSHANEAETREQQRMAAHQAQTTAQAQAASTQEARFNAQLEYMAEHQQKLLDEIARAVQSTQAQSQLMANQHQQLLTHLQASTESIQTSSQHMKSSTDQLGLLSATLQQAANQMGTRLDGLAQQIEATSQHNAQVADQLNAQLALLGDLQATLQNTGQQLELTAQTARSGFSEMKSHQEVFLQSLSDSFVTLTENLRQQVEGIERQAESWLQRYSNETQQQVSERMNAWDKQTLSFATKMQATVQAISDLVDELEGSQK